MTNKELLDLIEEMELVLSRACLHIPVKQENARILGEIFEVTRKAMKVIEEGRKDA